MRIKSNSGYEFSLLKNVIREVADQYPWLATRKNIKAALRNPANTSVALYLADKTTQTEIKKDDYYGQVALVKGFGFIRIGCKYFEGKNAEKLRRWASGK